MGMFDFFKSDSKDDLKDENARLREELAKMQEKLGKAEERNRELEKTLAETERANKRLDEKLAKAELDAQDARERFDDLDVDFLKSLGRIDQLEAENKALTEKNEKLVEVEKVIQANEENFGRLDELEKANKELQKKIENFDTSLGIVDLLKKELHDKSAEFPKTVTEPSAAENVAEKNQPKFPESADWVVKDWINPDAVLDRKSKFSSRITDVRMTSSCIECRLENGDERVLFNIGKGNSKETSRKVASRFREALVDRKLEDLCDVDVLKEVFGKHFKIEGRGNSEDIILTSEDGGYSVPFGRLDIFADEGFANNILDDITWYDREYGCSPYVTIDEHEAGFEDKTLCNIGRCCDDIEWPDDDSLWREYKDNFYMLEQGVVIPHNDIKFKITRAFCELFKDKVESFNGDKELAIFTHFARYGVEKFIDFFNKNDGYTTEKVRTLECSVSNYDNWKEANDTRAAVLIQCGLITKQEGQTLADYKPNISKVNGVIKVNSMPMLSDESRKILLSLPATGRAITDLTPEEAKVLSRDFKEAVKTIEAEKLKLKQAKEELLADCQQAGKAFACEGQNMTLEDVGKIYASKVEGKNGGLASFKKEAMEAIVKGYKEEKQKLADKQKGSKDNNKSQDKGSYGGERWQ